ncbi:MAG: hypothetical protein E6J34_21490 [Chloroflexi bacterium]|nr:MAG: hypothetical protein E6J34_21490 [Chloroflexota bacterium]
MTNTSTVSKVQQYSLARLQLAIDTIEELVPLERKRSSPKRRRRLEWAYAVCSVHCRKLNFTLPRLSTFYSEEQYLEHARLVADHMQQFAPSAKETSYE